MRPTALLHVGSGHLRVLLLLPNMCFLILLIIGGTPATCFAVSFSLGDELVTIGQNFTGLTSGESPDQIPPDSMGAVGPKVFVELINGGYVVYDLCVLCKARCTFRKARSRCFGKCGWYCRKILKSVADEVGRLDLTRSG